MQLQGTRWWMGFIYRKYSYLCCRFDFLFFLFLKSRLYIRGSHNSHFSEFLCSPGVFWIILTMWSYCEFFRFLKWFLLSPPRRSKVIGSGRVLNFLYFGMFWVKLWIFYELTYAVGSIFVGLTIIKYFIGAGIAWNAIITEKLTICPYFSCIFSSQGSYFFI